MKHEIVKVVEILKYNAPERISDKEFKACEKTNLKGGNGEYYDWCSFEIKPKEARVGDDIIVFDDGSLALRPKR